ncbi:MAG: helix-turn-helix transcriptional regulator, partial [Lachnospiraceae bacterium]|nr:helix-turn-helix transcriptional regulator [Lachnospiraceae bacterium]
YEVSGEALLQAVKSGSEKAAEECFLYLFADWIKTDDVGDADRIKLKCVGLLDDILRGLGDYRLQDYLGHPDKVLDVKKRITTGRLLDDVIDITRNMIVNLTLCVKEILAGNSKKLVSLAVSYIQENYQKDISLPQIAEYLYISPAYLSRIFSAEMQKPFSQYLRNYRITIAQKLLREGRLKIYEVAAQVGYSDVAHFSKSFKQITGVTPIHYREEPLG